MQEVLLRQFGTQDIQSFVEFDKTVFGEGGYSYIVARQLYDISGDLMYIATTPEGNIGGYIFGCIKNTGKDLPLDSWILALAVHPQYRNRGIAKKLTSKLIEQLTQLKVNNIYLTVDPKNKIAISLYGRIGFELFEYEDDYFGKGYSRIVMRKVLASNTL